jgi:hypothetical protein
LVVVQVVVVLTAAEAVALAVSELIFLVLFLHQLLMVPWDYPLPHIILKLVEVVLILVQHQGRVVMMLVKMVNLQHLTVKPQVAVDELDLVVLQAPFQDHSKLVVADPITVQVVAAVPMAPVAALVAVVPVLVVPVLQHLAHLVGLVVAEAALAHLLLV